LGRVIERLEQTRGELPDFQLRSYRHGRSRFAYEMMALLWHERLREARDEVIDSLIAAVEMAKSRTLLDMVAGAGLPARGSASDSLLKIEIALQRLLETEEQKAITLTDSVAIDSAARAIDDYRRRLDEARLAISLADSSLPGTFNPKSGLSVKRLTTSLDSGTAVLDYLLTPAHSMLIVLNAAGVEVFELSTRQTLADELINWIDILRTSAVEDTGLVYLEKQSKLMAQLLLSDFVDEVDNYDRLIVLPDGPLAMLPFSALKIGDRYLVEYAEVIYLPSLLFLNELKEPFQPPQIENLLAVAGPQAGDHLATLHFSQVEVDNIIKLLPDADIKVLSGAGAVSRALGESKDKQCRHLHFATHSTIDHDDPLRSKLWVGPDSIRDEGYITLAEVMRFQLDADLVVLSSCESGGGRYHLGEGIEGFTKGFMYAGARNIIVSLWPVEDFRTMAFMSHFYRNLHLGYVTALRQAKLEMLTSARRPHRHPYYWSPFIIISSPSTGADQNQPVQPSR
jgi:CHAT domain-containing protein